MSTPRENFEKMFRHEIMDYFPHLGTDAWNFRDYSIERPMFTTGYDAWGCHWISCPDSMNITHPDTKLLLFEEAADWKEKVKFPDIENHDYSQEYEMLQGYTDEVRKEKMLCYVSLNGIFERSHVLMGFENALCEFLEEPETFGEMLEAFADHKIRLFRKIYQMFQPDILMYHDDMATQQSQFLPTRLYQDYLFPQYKRIVDAAREIGYKYIIHHSCGKIEALLPDWLSCGFDGLDSLMPCNDLKKIKETYGDRLVFWPGGNCQQVLGIPGIDPKEIEKMVLDYYDMLGYDGKGLCMDTTAAYSMNPENEKICLEMQRKHGKAYIDAVKAGKNYRDELK